MIYAGQIQNQQYAQYANRSIGHKQDYAGTEKSAMSRFSGYTKNWKSKQENQTVAERKVNETKRKRSLYKRFREKGMGTYINRYV